jgi:hypothetical protein
MNYEVGPLIPEVASSVVIFECKSTAKVAEAAYFFDGSCEAGSNGWRFMGFIQKPSNFGSSESRIKS